MAIITVWKVKLKNNGEWIDGKKEDVMIDLKVERSDAEYIVLTLPNHTAFQVPLQWFLAAIEQAKRAETVRAREYQRGLTAS